MPIIVPGYEPAYEPWMIAYLLGLFHCVLMLAGGTMLDMARNGADSMMTMAIQTIGLLSVLALHPFAGVVFVALVSATSAGNGGAAVILLLFGVVSWFLGCSALAIPRKSHFP